MRRPRRKRLLLAVAAAAALAGLTAAVVMAAQPGAARRRQPHGALATAAAYLGTGPRQLRAELRSGKSLAQLAQADGKPVAGLTQALEAAARERLKSAQADLSSRVAAEVDHVRARSLAATAAAYLGTSPADLRRQLRSGTTLAQLAAAHGKSRAGLLDALLDARKAALAARLQAGQITQPREAKALSRLQPRLEALLARKLPGHAARRRHAATR
ncbi:MAG TPA: hypothetical protein VGY13_09845 [Solirubrobacteraceae bacterium]|jgi:fructosamine-3-kinase|nr:hypothetical protein [Solirubrobacteraceae bacterium]